MITVASKTEIVGRSHLSFFLFLYRGPSTLAGPDIPCPILLPGERLLSGSVSASLGQWPTGGCSTPWGCVASSRTHLPPPFPAAPSFGFLTFLSPCSLGPSCFHNHMPAICTAPAWKAGWAVLAVPHTPQLPLQAQAKCLRSHPDKPHHDPHPNAPRLMLLPFKLF